MPKHHVLKIHGCYFDAVRDGRKTFEIRKDDREFKEGDTGTLNELAGPLSPSLYTGRSINFVITYVTSFFQREGWVVFGIKVTESK